MGAGVEIFQSLLDERNLHGEYDPIVNGSVNSVVQPDFDCGLFIYNEKFYTGLSAARLIGSSGVASGDGSLRNYFLIAGFLTGEAKDNIRFLPSIVLKFTESLQKQIDLNVKTLFSESWWLGLSIRHNFDRLPGNTMAIIPMTGLTKNNFSFGYSLELTPGKILTHNYGTHEFTIAYRFCKDGFRCPVYR